MNNEVNNGKIKNIIIIILVALLIIASGFIYYDKIFSNKKSVCEKKCPVCEKCNSKSEIIGTSWYINQYEKLVEKYMMGNPPTNCSTIEIFANDKVVKANDISNLYAANTVILNLENLPNTISLEEFDNEIKKLFGSDYVFNPETLVDKAELAEYKYSDKVFIKRSNNWGGTCGPTSSYKVVDFKKYDNVLEVYLRVIFAGLDEEGLYINKYYSDYNRTNLIVSDRYPDEDEYKKGDLYKLTFNTDSVNYKFISSELSN